MTNLAKLAEETAKLDDKLSACMKCGTCQSVCPIFKETLMEADVARGKLSLLSDIESKVAKDAEGVRSKLDRCLLCGSCQAACPSGVNILDIFIKAREISAQYMGLSPVKKIIFRAMLCNPRFFSFCAEVSAPFRGLFMRRQNNAPRTLSSPLLAPIIGDRRLPELPKKTIRQKYGDYDTPAGKSGLKVLFFTGCMGDKVYPNVTEACLKIFKHYGIGVSMPSGLACCGIPALASGDADSFKKMASYNLDILGKLEFDYVVTACASCTETIEQFWPRYAEGAQKATAEKISAKTLDISAFLVDVIGLEKPAQARVGAESGRREKVTYHDSCHLAKSLGVRRQPRELVKANPECELIEMREPDTCCGCGGSFTLTHYDISKKIGGRKRENIVASGADTVACGCPACMMQISNMLALNGDEVKVKHVAELYADSLDK